MNTFLGIPSGWEFCPQSKRQMTSMFADPFIYVTMPWDNSQVITPDARGTLAEFKYYRAIDPLGHKQFFYDIESYAKFREWWAFNYLTLCYELNSDTRDVVEGLLGLGQ